MLSLNSVREGSGKLWELEVMQGLGTRRESLEEEEAGVTRANLAKVTLVYGTLWLDE